MNDREVYECEHYRERGPSGGWTIPYGDILNPAATAWDDDQDPEANQLDLEAVGADNVDLP
jgi:hypothetical protein